MKNIVNYDISNSWVRKICCPKCNFKTYYWYSSGMSQSFPHFYCNSCSNVILKSQDRKKLLERQTIDILNELITNLPNCGCGGKFISNANPKCPNCQFEFKHQGNELDRLTDPHMIVLDGSCVYSDDGYEYTVKINQ